MAPVLWSNLPTDVLTLIIKILNTDVDILRLRSVCSSWRSSVRPRLRPSPFPLKLPPLNPESVNHLVLNYTTLYHISPPEYGPHAGDHSDGWLVRALEVNPNRFSLLPPLFPNNLEFPPGTIPKCLSLLDYRISEVCKCYTLKFSDYKSSDTLRNLVFVDKVIVLCNYASGCEFAVVALFPDCWVCYWKFGDKEWTRIDTKEYAVTDLVVFKGRIYAICRQGVLVSFDSEFNLTELRFPSLPRICCAKDNFLVEYKADLYAITKMFAYPNWDEGEDEVYHNEVPLRLEIFKKCGNWERIGCLGDGIFLSSANLSVGLSVEDFRGLKGNRVYFAHYDLVYSDVCEDSIFYGVYNLDEGRRISLMKMHQRHTLHYWPTPGWLAGLCLLDCTGFWHM